MIKTKKVKEPLFHISKRSDIEPWKAWCIRIGSGLLALLVGAILTGALTGHFFGFFEQLIKGSFGSVTRFEKLIKNTVILLGIALALAPAFKMKFWNIGAEGQVLIGALVTAGLMFNIKDSIPQPALIIIMFACSVMAGAIWALIPAIFKAFFNTNETLFTLMMNYIAIKLTAYFINIWATNGSGTMGIIPYGQLPKLFGSQYLINILVVIVLTVIVYMYLKYSKHGYELSVVGESLNTAKYVGINVKKVIIRTMIFSGVICGIVGFLLVSGDSYTITQNLVNGRGFTAILVAWLSQFNPLAMVLTSFLVCFLEQTGSQLVMAYNMGADAYSSILTGIFFLFIIGSTFFINYKVVINKKHKNIKVEESADESKDESLSTLEESSKEEVVLDGPKMEVAE